MSHLIKKTLWDLTPLFKSDNDPQIETQRKIIEKNINNFVEKWNKKDFLKSESVLKEALDDYEALMRNYGTTGAEGYYFSLRTQQDENNPELKAKFNSIIEFGNQMQNRIQFFTLRLSKADPIIQEKLLNSKKLADYKHFLERLFAESSHVLSEQEEKILNLKAAIAYYNWVRMTSGFLSKEEAEVWSENSKHEKKNFSEIISLLNSSNKKVRDSANEAFNKILEKHLEVAEAEINSVLGNKRIDDMLRNFRRPDESRHLSDDIETEVVDQLLMSVEKRFNISQRFYQLKAELMGVSKLLYHERNVEMGSITQSYSFEEAAQLVHKIYNNLDPRFGEIFKDFFDHGNTDVFPQKGKRGGAFCVYNLITQPTYLLLNYTNKLQDVLTFAHELGHGVNDELMKQKQNALNFGTSTSTAEVASTFMEDFVLQELLKVASEEEQLALLMTKLNQDISSIFRQVACYRFEQELHDEFGKKGYLSYQQIGTIFQKHMSAYMGDSVEQSKGSENWWVYWSHIRTYFYVYSYASGLLISKSLQASVKADATFINKVIEFLSSGLSASPKTIFANLSIDITDKKFWNKGLDEIEELLNQTEKLARKLKKI